jgi:cytochrome P450
MAETAVTLPRFDPVSPELFVDPYPVYERYRRAEPVHWGLSALAGFPGAWYVFRHADVQTVLKDERFGKARRQVSYGAAAASAVPEPARGYLETARQWIAHRDAPEHDRLKDALWPHFTAGAADRLRPVIARVADDLLDEASGATFDVVADYAARLPFQVICAVVGVPAADRPRFEAWSAAMRAVGLRTSDPVWTAASDAARDACAYLADLVQRRRREPADGDNLAGALVAAREAGAFVSDEELAANLLFLIYAAAGLFTTTALIASGVHLLLTHPDQRAALAAEPALIANAVHEVLRVEPPLQLTNRIARVDVTMGGRTVEAGASVLAVLASANRDPSAHEDPDRFDITRRRRPHHTFSAGAHTCFGGPLASVQGEVAIAALLRRHPRLHLAGPVAWTPTGSLRLLEHLPVSP